MRAPPKRAPTAIEKNSLGSRNSTTAKTHDAKQWLMQLNNNHSTFHMKAIIHETHKNSHGLCNSMTSKTQPTRRLSKAIVHSVQRQPKPQSHAGLDPQQLGASSQTSPEEAGAGATTGRALARHDECRVNARILVACYYLVITNKHFTQQRIQLEVSLHVSLHEPPMLTVHP